MCGPYSGIVFGISNTFATIPGIISPFLVEELLKYVILLIFYFNKIILDYLYSIIIFKNAVDGWRNFFIISIIIYFIGGLSFIIFATSTTLSWAKITKDQNVNNQTSEKRGETNLVYDMVTKF